MPRPRRAPPTSLRLHQGPMPSRGQPKHTLPSLPRPAFSPPASTRRSDTRSASPDILSPHPNPYGSGTGTGAGTTGSGGALYSCSNWSVGSVCAEASQSLTQPGVGLGTGIGLGTGSGSGGSSPAPSPSPKQVVRGPWDHSIAVSLSFDVGRVLALPKRAAVSP